MSVTKVCFRISSLIILALSLSPNLMAQSKKPQKLNFAQPESLSSQVAQPFEGQSCLGFLSPQHNFLNQGVQLSKLHKQFQSLLSNHALPDYESEIIIRVSFDAQTNTLQFSSSPNVDFGSILKKPLIHLKKNLAQVLGPQTEGYEVIVYVPIENERLMVNDQRMKIGLIPVGHFFRWPEYSDDILLVSEGPVQQAMQRRLPLSPTTESSMGNKDVNSGDIVESYEPDAQTEASFTLRLHKSFLADTNINIVDMLKGDVSGRFINVFVLINDRIHSGFLQFIQDDVFTIEVHKSQDDPSPEIVKNTREKVAVTSGEVSSSQYPIHSNVIYRDTLHTVEGVFPDGRVVLYRKGQSSSEAPLSEAEQLQNYEFQDNRDETARVAVPVPPELIKPVE